MTHHQTSPTDKLTNLFTNTNSSVRLQAALTAGTLALPELVRPLIDQCAVEEDFAVREMLTWALLQLPVDLVLARLLVEVSPTTAQSELGQAQALHTLSKLGDRRSWRAITPALLHHTNPEIARTAWRTAVATVSDRERGWLAQELSAELGRGDRELQRSLSRAFAQLGEPAEAVLRSFVANLGTMAESRPAMHAAFTLEMLYAPDANFAYTPDEARRTATVFSGTRRAHR